MNTLSVHFSVNSMSVGRACPGCKVQRWSCTQTVKCRQVSQLSPIWHLRGAWSICDNHNVAILTNIIYTLSFVNRDRSIINIDIQRCTKRVKILLSLAAIELVLKLSILSQIKVQWQLEAQIRHMTLYRPMYSMWCSEGQNLQKYWRPRT